VGFVSLGCPKALVDSERIITELRLRGYAIAPEYQGADLVVVNTCGFIDSAIDESLDGHRRGARPERPRGRDRVPGHASGSHPRAPPEGAGDHRPARHRGRARGTSTRICRSRTIRTSICCRRRACA
jgi:hypothetical protein